MAPKSVACPDIPLLDKYSTGVEPLEAYLAESLKII